MRVKLQPPSGTSLPAYNPFLPPTAVTQVMLIARNKSGSGSNENVRLKYKFSYCIENENCLEVGEIDSLYDEKEN